MTSDGGVGAQDVVGLFRISLTAGEDCRFDLSPARSLHAALLRRTEWVSPDLSQSLHDHDPGLGSPTRPWSVSTLIGELDRDGGARVARAGSEYQVRIGVLTGEMANAIAAAFDPSHPLGSAPLYLENVEFKVELDNCGWEQVTSYQQMLARARPVRKLSLRFRSPTGFRTSSAEDCAPTPRRCVESWLRRWNAFSPVAMPAEDLLRHVEERISVREADLRPARAKLGMMPAGRRGDGETQRRPRAEFGVVGAMQWEADPEASPVMLRMVDALAEYSRYCGTGLKTAQGMGQTSRVRSAARRGS